MNLNLDHVLELQRFMKYTGVKRCQSCKFACLLFNESFLGK